MANGVTPTRIDTDNTAGSPVGAARLHRAASSDRRERGRAQGYTSRFDWLHQVGNGTRRVCHNTNPANVGNLMWGYYNTSPKHRRLLCAFIDVSDGDIGMPK
ncbi:hypothetical protein AZKH_p0117 (plasmid) [Azoarcus sp. KH32C]|nr:hypothetical protein AZKH_p0117 [Azoarcus sp. KH32C]